MNFLNHKIIEPKKLLLAWKERGEEPHSPTHIVAELNLKDSGIDLVYLVHTKDFHVARERGFESYPAFPDVNKTYSNVLSTFMRRLPPRSRGDFPRYLERIGIKPEAMFSDFALLGYSGAKLLSDGFSIIRPSKGDDEIIETE